MSDGQRKEYDCGYCGKNFKIVVRKTGASKKAYVSTQVKCPRCGNFLKTWDEGKVVSIIKKNRETSVNMHANTDVSSVGV